MENTSTVSAVVRVFAILEDMATHPDAGISDLADRLKLPKATIHRFVKTLESMGYVKQQANTERYRLTMKLFELSSQIIDHLDIISIAGEYMQKLSDLTGETVHLGSIEDGAMVYLHKIPSRHALQLVSKVGRRAPVHCTAIGKAISAALPEEEGRIQAGVAPFTRFTENTIVSQGQWDEELITIQGRGYAMDDQEHELNVRCFAVPVFDRNNMPIAGISISIPTFRLDEEFMPEILQQLRNAGQSVSTELGSTVAAL
ncbi:IclR family transcriptional regulator [Parendozoicomonas haliclonae]|uniref:Transcriptional regulator KdgR n=1 Tax=Parendozoicomonas haliclonae TaxID=1960125 RepID=A0A1X7AIU1_9GAMM|nr:IclR family transcriptional regulator C-terminal domain-containing protein [Parendozoicomonas haliclonae]SMA39543.1 Transcriptional regulator KdgR [Parendozoicomonas haliclonae]